jgi:pimeloyl-ACP methyl ester carboxylesterase
VLEPRPIEVELADLTIRGLEWGDPAAPLTLAFHGWLDNAASFSMLAPLLVERGRRVVAVDLPGHAKSDPRSSDAHYHYINYAIDAVAIVDELGCQTVELMGHSMGAGVALLAAPALGDRLSRVHCIEGLGPMTTPGKDAAETFIVAVDARRRVGTRQRSSYPDLESAIARKAEAIGVAQHVAEPLVRRAVVETGSGVQFADDPRLKGRSHIRLTEEQVHSFFRAVKAPVTVVRASDGLKYPEEAMKARLGSLPDVRVVDVEGGHHVHMTAPVAVMSALDE